MNSELASDIKEFLSDYIHSVGILEALFLFYNHSNVGWDSTTLSRELRSNQGSAAKQISSLLEFGFIQERTGKYYYSQKDIKFQSLVTSLYKVYQERPVSIIAFIYENPAKQLTSFANAFKLKKE